MVTLDTKKKKKEQNQFCFGVVFNLLSCAVAALWKEAPHPGFLACSLKEFFVQKEILFSLQEESRASHPPHTWGSAAAVLQALTPQRSELPRP